MNIRGDAGQLDRIQLVCTGEDQPMTSQPAAQNQSQQPEAAAGPARPAPAAGVPQPHRIRRTRSGSAWVAAALFAVVLLLLLIFILQNGRTVAVSFFGATGHLPLGVALLLAAVLGVLLVIIPGTARIIQLRMTARRHRRLDAAQPGAGPSSPPPPGQPENT
jgi:uncharacterized integral membrane protein